MDVDTRFNLIKHGTEEIVSEEELKNLLAAKHHPTGYIGFASTGRVHIGYFIPLMKVADFIKAGFKFTILMADVHAHLDNQKSPWELLGHRFEYYEHAITSMLRSLGVDTDHVKLVRGSDVQLTHDYMMDLLKLSAITTLARSKRAAHEVVKFGDDPRLSGFIYPLMQALDEEYLKVDVQLGGLDQRKILMFARESLPLLGYKPRVEVMTPMLPGLSGDKMSSSDEKSKIDVLDSPDSVKKKMAGAFCPMGTTDNNGVLAFMKYVVMKRLESRGEKFVIDRPEKWGGKLSYATYAELEKAYLDGTVHPQDLKTALADEINKLLEPIRKDFEGKEKMIERAYPQK